MKIENAFKKYFDLVNNLPFEKVEFKIDEEYKKCMVSIYCKRITAILYNQRKSNYRSSISDVLFQMEDMFPYQFYFKEFVFTDTHPSMIPEEYFGKKGTLIV
jgi:hypothetical protein